MRFAFRVLLAGSLTIWTASFVCSVSAAPEAAQKKTTDEGVYTKAQADGAKEQFDKLCAECHPFTVAAKKKPKDKPLGDEPFFEDWGGRTLGELVTLIHLTMPNDGSADVSDEEAANLVAYILQQNGFPTGPDPLTKQSAAGIVLSKKTK
jgi:polar amino acid transport system substrate-binding protein